MRNDKEGRHLRANTTLTTTSNGDDNQYLRGIRMEVVKFCICVSFASYEGHVREQRTAILIQRVTSLFTLNY